MFLHFIHIEMTKNVFLKGDWYTPKKFIPVYNYKSIYDLYKNPSFYKVNVYNEWKNKLDKIIGLTWNSMQFSIYGKIDWKLVKITKNYNYIME